MRIRSSFGLRHILAVILVATTTIAPTLASFEVDIARELQDTQCPTLCDSGGIVGVPENVLPIFPQGALNCSTVDALLAAADATVCRVVSQLAPYLDFGAFCGCTGSTPPDSCEGCAAGGTVQDPSATFTVDVLGGATFTCAEGNAVLPYLSNAVACSAFVSLYDDACCVGASTPSASAAPNSPADTTPAPSPVISVPPDTEMPAAMPSVTTPAPSSAGRPAASPSAVTESDMPSMVPTSNAPQPSSTDKPTIINEPTAAPNAGGSPTPPSPSVAPAAGPTSAAPVGLSSLWSLAAAVVVTALLGLLEE